MKWCQIEHIPICWANKVCFPISTLTIQYVFHPHNLNRYSWIVRPHHSLALSVPPNFYNKDWATKYPRPKIYCLNTYIICRIDLTFKL